MARRDERSGGRQPPLPKPYDFVAIPADRADLKPPTGHARYPDKTLTGTIEGLISALSPIHIASGNIELTGRQPSLVKAHFRCAGKPTIPGSSLKGAIRSIVEAISNPPSCARITHARFDTLPQVARQCRDKNKLCLACRLFGAMGYLGRVQFHDAPLSNGETDVVTIPSLFAPRSRERVYFEGPQVKGRKFYKHGLGDGQPARGNVPIEVCRKGSQFTLRVDFVSLSRDELGLLLVALGQGDPPLFPKLGGGKPACCGSVRVQTVSVMTFPAASLEFDAEPVPEDAHSLVSGTRHVRADACTRLRQILRFPGEIQCTDRSY